MTRSNVVKPMRFPTPEYTAKFKAREIDQNGLFWCAGCGHEWMWEETETCENCSAITHRFFHGDTFMGRLVPTETDLSYLRSKPHTVNLTDLDEASAARICWLQDKQIAESNHV